MQAKTPKVSAMMLSSACCGRMNQQNDTAPESCGKRSKEIGRRKLKPKVQDRKEREPRAVAG
jgi:hypothetical protein